MKTTSKRYGVAELAALLADLARPVTDAAAAEGITVRVVRERTHQAAAWVVALVTGRRTTTRGAATVVVDDGRRNSPRVVWAAGRATVATGRPVRPYRRTDGIGAAFDAAPAPAVVYVAPVSPDHRPMRRVEGIGAGFGMTAGAPPAAPTFRGVEWEPADLLTTPADPAFNAPVAPPPAASAPSSVDVWGVELPRSRRIERAPGGPVPVDAPAAELATDDPATAAAPAPVADEFVYAVELTPPVVEPVKPTRKPRARKPATPKVKTMTSAARVTTPPATGSSAPVYTADVRPLPLVQLARHGVGNRFGAAATVRGGWVTDTKVLIRVPEADREALAAKVADNGGRAVPAAEVIPAAIDPRPFALTGREWAADQESVGVLTREDGETCRVDLRLYLTLLRHSPKGTALYAGATATGRGRGAGRPLVAHAGDPAAYTRDAAAGALMPLVTDGNRYTPWHADDEPLTLRGGKGAGASYTLSRGEWRVLLPFLSGATAADLEAAGGKLAMSAKERGKLAPVIDAAGGRAAVAKLVGDQEGAAAAA